MSRDGLRGLSRDVVVYGTGSVALQLVGLVTVPVLTRVFRPSDYGVIETITTLTLAVGIVASLSLGSASQRSYFDYPESEESRRRTVLGTTFWTLLAWTSALGIGLATAASPISQLLFGTHRWATPIALAMLTIPLTQLSAFFLEILRLRRRAALYGALSVSGAVFTIGLLLYVVAVRHDGLSGFYAATLCGGLVAIVPAWLVVRRTFGFQFDRHELRTMLVYGLPLLPVSASAWILQLADRFFLLHFSSLRDVGLYALGVRLSNVMLVVVSAIAIAWSPFILELHSRDPDAERVLRGRALTYVAFLLCTLTVLLSVFARDFFRIVTDPAFESSYMVVGILCAGLVCIGLNSVTITAITLARKTGYFARYAFYTGAVNMALNFLLIPPFGMVGAATATSASYATQAAFYYRRAQQLDPVDYDVRRIGTIVAAATIVVVAGTLVRADSVVVSVLVKIPIVLAFPLLVWMLRGFDDDFRAFVRQLFRLRPGPFNGR